MLGLLSTAKPATSRFAYQSTLLISRTLAVTGRHSKIVAGKKNRLDAQKNKLFTRLGVKILMAAKAGGTDPSNNPDLARVLKEAHSIKLPKENIDRALSKAKDSSSESFTAGVYEVFGFGGAGLVVCSLTDNPTRAVKEIKALVRKSDVKVASAGSVLFNFEQKAVFHAQQEYNKDELLDKALELDMSDVQFLPTADHPFDMIVAKAEELGLLQDLTSQLTGSTSLAYIPVETVSVSAADREKNNEVIEAFEDLHDVDAVYHNMQSS
eukprot:gene31979-38667_t